MNGDKCNKKRQRSYAITTTHINPIQINRSEVNYECMLLLLFVLVMCRIRKFSF